MPHSAFHPLRSVRRDAAEAVAAPDVPGGPRRSLGTAGPRSRGNLRRGTLVALGTAVVVTCALAASLLTTHADRHSGYVAVARFVPEGAVVTASDLTIVHLSLPGGLSALAAGRASTVIGLRASEPLRPGTLLSPAEVGSTTPLDPAEALVGTSLAADQTPAGLRVGDSVLVIAGTGGAAGAGGPAETTGASVADGSVPYGDLITTGTVYSLDASDSSGDEIVTVEVPRAEAASVTAASSTGDVALAVISGGAG